MEPGPGTYTLACAPWDAPRSMEDAAASSRVSGCGTGCPGVGPISYRPAGQEGRSAASQGTSAGSRLRPGCLPAAAQDSSEMPAEVFLVTITSHTGLHPPLPILTIMSEVTPSARAWGALGGGR